MPTCRRKRVVLTEPSDALLQAAKSNPNKEVYYLAQTGEIFETYESYAARMSFYRQKHFQCEVTGKGNLDYFQAVESEQQEARTMHSRFSEPLKPAILKAVQWQIMGRLDHLVEAVYDRFKDRYFKDERVFVDVQGDKFYAKVVEVFPPKSHDSINSDDSYIIHNVTGDLKIPAKDAMAHDDPAKYFYKVQILEEEKDKAQDKSRSHAKQPDPGRAKWNGSLMEVQCGAMSRDRLAFSKSILKRFIRDCVDRSAAVASPWTVKPAIAKRYGVASVMPEETRKDVEEVKKGETDKRKKVWEDKEGPPFKKPKKLTAAQEERAKAAAVAAEKKEREAREKADRQQKAKEEAERLAAEKKKEKKKPIRYPTEDLDVRISEKDKRAGMSVRRPVPSRIALPFSEFEGCFEPFMMAWNFLVVYGQPLHLSTFTLDDFEHALRHTVADLPCSLLAEVHSALVYNLRTVPFKRHAAVISFMESEDKEDVVLGITIDQLNDALADVGSNWERVPLRHAEGREGWEEALVGCLKNHATTANFPGLRQVLTRLLFQPKAKTPATVDIELIDEEEQSPPPSELTLPANPVDRYYALDPPDRIAIISFMCNLAVSSKAIHAHMESCEEQLTALRKEKIEVNRQKKQYVEDMNALLEETKEKEEEPTPAPVEEGTPVQDLGDMSDTPASENGSDVVRPKVSARVQDLRAKAAQMQAHAKQRELARARAALAKQAMAEHRRLDEEVNKLDRRLEGIEREFRKLLGSVRVKPLGKDRFYNRIWWFDGMGSASLLGSGGVVQYGTGRIFVQGPNQWDYELMARREDNDVLDRRREEEGEHGMLNVDEWAAFSDLEEVDEFLAWLNPKGVRELALKNAFTKWWPHISPGMRKRIADLNTNAKLPEARRSSRMRTGPGRDVSRDPYMLWTNRRAVNAT